MSSKEEYVWNDGSNDPPGPFQTSSPPIILPQNLPDTPPRDFAQLDTTYTFVNTRETTAEMARKMLSFYRAHRGFISAAAPIHLSTTDLPFPNVTPDLYIDLEGNRLGRNGTVSIIHVFFKPDRHTYLVDVTTLGPAAFDTPEDLKEGVGGNVARRLTMRNILESMWIIKVFFDCCNDNDALYSHFDIITRGIVDLQILDYAANPNVLGSDFNAEEWVIRTWLSNLGSCIFKDAGLSPEQRDHASKVKTIGKQLFKDSYAVFDVRPLAPELLDYCINDVVHMVTLFQKYHRRISKHENVSKVILKYVMRHSTLRLEESRRDQYDPDGPRELKTRGPWFSATHKIGRR